MKTNFSRSSFLPDFSIDNYEIWKYRVSSFLIAQHTRMWDVITQGPIIIEEATPSVSAEAGKDTTCTLKPKDKAKFTIEERKQDELNSLARNIISATVSDKYVLKIMKCTTTKVMWETLEEMCIGSDEIKENKLTIACEKFDNFKMRKGESIDEMEIRFNKILNEVRALSANKYSQREINLKILRALLANEFDIQRNKEALRTGGSEEDTPQPSKRAGLKATLKDLSKAPKEKSVCSTDDLLTQYNLMVERFNRMESKLKKYRRFHKHNSRGKDSHSHRHRSSKDRAD